MKSTTTEYTKDRFMKIIADNILNAKFDVAEIIAEVQDMEKEIIDDLRSGSKLYLTPAKVNPMNAYKFPMRNMGFRGVLAWNLIYPTKEIQLPDDVDLVKTTIKSVEDIEYIKEIDEEVYDAIYKKIFLNQNEEIRKKGIGVVAVPRNEDIPEWLVQCIDVNNITNDVLNKFYPVLNSLGVNIYGKKSTNSRTYYSNIIEL